MRVPVFRVRTLILVIAGLAIVLAMAVEGLKRRRLRTWMSLAAAHAAQEDYWRDQEAAMRRWETVELAKGRRYMAATCAAQAAYNHDQARYHEMLRRWYEDVLSGRATADKSVPPPPRLSPRDYMAGAPSTRARSEGRP